MCLKGFSFVCFCFSLESLIGVAFYAAQIIYICSHEIVLVNYQGLGFGFFFCLFVLYVYVYFSLKLRWTSPLSLMVSTCRLLTRPGTGYVNRMKFLIPRSPVFFRAEKSCNSLRSVETKMGSNDKINLIAWSIFFWPIISIDRFSFIMIHYFRTIHLWLVNFSPVSNRILFNFSSIPFVDEYSRKVWREAPSKWNIELKKWFVEKSCHILM